MAMIASCLTYNALTPSGRHVLKICYDEACRSLARVGQVISFNLSITAIGGDRKLFAFSPSTSWERSAYTATTIAP